MKISFTKKLFCFFILILSIEILFSKENKPIDLNNLKKREFYALRISEEIRIDGLLDEKSWSEANSAGPYIQLEPNNLELGTEITDMKILYDDKNIYVGVKCYDDVEMMKNGLFRRDYWPGVDYSEQIFVQFGPQNDGLNAYSFSVSSSGVQMDGIISKDVVFDQSWDAVWDSEVVIEEDAWIAEFKIPLSIFSYPNKKVQTWMFKSWRTIHRKLEWDVWPGFKVGDPGNVSNGGILRGIENIPSQKNIDIQPYFLGGQIRDNKTENSGNIGLDFSYPLFSNSQISGTINPDFGQVEADPSVLNLTAFETFFQEKRPFFVKGAQFFNEGAAFGNNNWSYEGEGSFINKPIMLFNSRRIGRTPQAIDYGEEIIDQPMQTRILGAGKIFGKTNNNLSYGALTSATSEEYGVFELIENGEAIRNEKLIEPLTYYTVGRLEKSVMNELSTIGFMFTNVNPNNLNQHNAIAFDWMFKLLENKFNFGGQLVSSNVSSVSGSAGRLDLRYDNTSWFDLLLQGGQYSEGFNVNRLGYLNRDGVKGFVFKGTLKRLKPTKRFFRNFLDLSYFEYLKLDNTPLIKEIQLSSRNTFSGFWDLNWKINRSLKSFDDRDTFRNDEAKILERPMGWRYSITLMSNPRKKFYTLTTVAANEYDSGTKMRSINSILRYNITNSLTLSINPILNNIVNNEQWVDLITDSNLNKIIYSKSTQAVQALILRMDYLFTSKLSFQAYYQPFEANVEYENFKYLIKERTLNFLSYDYQENPNFLSKTSVGTFVLRWEFSPGSRLFLVYNLNESNYFSDSDNSWEKTKTNSVFLKLDYFIKK